MKKVSGKNAKNLVMFLYMAETKLKGRKKLSSDFKEQSIVRYFRYHKKVSVNSFIIDDQGVL